MRKRYAAGLATGWLLAGLASAMSGCAALHQCAGPAECNANERLTRAVRTQLAQYPELLPPNQVFVETRNGVVYLTGQVATDLQRVTAESAARQTAGVHKVIDNIALGYHGR
jgi:osmotically-inducible protein OsmY